MRRSAAQLHAGLLTLRVGPEREWFGWLPLWVEPFERRLGWLARVGGGHVGRDRQAPGPTPMVTHAPRNLVEAGLPTGLCEARGTRGNASANCQP